MQHGQIRFIRVFIASLEANAILSDLNGSYVALFRAIFLLVFHRKDTHIEPEIESQKVASFEGAAQHQVEQQLQEGDNIEAVDLSIGRQGRVLRE
jgi:hypothetical protein